MEDRTVPEATGASTGTGAEGGRRPTGGPVPPPADTEVVVPGKRRRFTKAYKLSILNTVAGLKKECPGKLGEYLRSEGLYYSTVKQWRFEQVEGTLSEHAKGSLGYVRESMARENAKLKRQLAAVQKKLEQAELLVELQKKVSQLILAGSAVKQSENDCAD